MHTTTLVFNAEYIQEPPPANDDAGNTKYPARSTWCTSSPTSDGAGVTRMD